MQNCFSIFHLPLSHSAISAVLFSNQQEKKRGFVKQLAVVFISGVTACLSGSKIPQGFLNYAVSWYSGRVITQGDVFERQ